VTLRWSETWPEARPVLALGVTFLLQNLTLGAGAYFSRILIINELGLAAVGLFTASYTLSTYYVQLILKAMSTDFYPRLTAVANDPVTMNRMVNEQIEMGVLMATPGVLGILALAPWILLALYSNDFAAAAGIIRWMILGVFIQVISWPIGTIILAKNRKKIFVSAEILSATLGVGLLALAIPWYGLEGIGIASASTQALMGVLFLGISQHAMGFRINRRALTTAVTAGLTVTVCACVAYVFEPKQAFIMRLILALGSTIVAAILLNNLLKLNLVCRLWRWRP
jgi:antigen flippase